MSRLSIRSTLSYTFSTYFKNFTTLAPLAAVTGFFTFLFTHLPTTIGSYFLTPEDFANAAATESAQALTASIESQSMFMQVLGLVKKSALLQHSSNTIHTIAIVGLTIILAITYMLVYFAFLKILLNFSKEKNPTTCALFKWDNSIIKALSGTLLYLVIVWGTLALVAGLFTAAYFILNKFFALGSLVLDYHVMIALIIALVLLALSIISYIGTRFFGFIFIMLDQNSGIREAFRKSWIMTKGSVTKIFLSIIIISILGGAIAGIIGTVITLITLKVTASPLIIGFVSVIASSIVTLPLFGLSFVNIYQKLTR